MEEYRDIPDFPNYQVSNLGNVKNKKTNKILKARALKKKGDYVCYDVCLYNDSRRLGFHKKIHRLVAEAFISNPNPNMFKIIDHIDRNPANNKVDNLRWVDYSINAINSKTRNDNELGERNICIIFDKYYVIIERDKKQVFYNSYDTLDDAIKARDDFNNGIIQNTHKKRTSNSGERNITKRSENSFRVEIVKDKITFRKSFKTLKEAVEARDNFLKD